MEIPPKGTPDPVSIQAAPSSTRAESDLNAPSRAVILRLAKSGPIWWCPRIKPNSGSLHVSLDVHRCDAIVSPDPDRTVENSRQSRSALRGEEDRSSGAAADTAHAGHVSVREAGADRLRFRQEHDGPPDRRAAEVSRRGEVARGSEGAHRQDRRLREELFGRGHRWHRREGRDVPDRPAEHDDAQGRAVCGRLRAAELLFPRHHGLRHPAPVRRRDRQAGFSRAHRSI